MSDTLERLPAIPSNSEFNNQMNHCNAHTWTYYSLHLAQNCSIPACTTNGSCTEAMFPSIAAKDQAILMDFEGFSKEATAKRQTNRCVQLTRQQQIQFKKKEHRNATWRLLKRLPSCQMRHTESPTRVHLGSHCGPLENVQVATRR